MEKDGDWFSEHFDELYRDHVNEFVAIENEQVIGHDSRLDRLLETMRANGKNTALILIEFIHDKKTKFIL